MIKDKMNLMIDQVPDFENCYVIADAHLDIHQKSKRNAKLTQFIDTQLSKNDILVILGDFFDIWLGRASLWSSEIKRVIDKLHQFVLKGGQCYLVVGNRDCIFRQKKKSKGITKNFPFHIISTHYLIIETVKKKRIFFHHGDLINTKDHNYLKLRKKILQNTKLLLLPNFLLHFITNKFYSKYANNNGGFKIYFPEADWKNYIQKTFDEFKIDQIIVGHFHPSNLIETKKRQFTALILPAWLNDCSYLKINQCLEYQHVQF